jgi:site-specific recombinase XerD
MVAPPPFTRITVANAVEEYLTSVHRAVLSASLSPATEKNYTRDLHAFLNLCDQDTVLDDLTAADIDDIILAYAAEPDRRYTKSRKPGPGPGQSPVGRGPGAQARFRASLSRLFAFAVRRGYVQQDPMPDTVVRPRTKDLRAAARTALPQPTAAALLSTPDRSATKRRKDQELSQRDTVILRILMEVGPRVSELCQFDRADVDLRDSGTWLNIRNGKGGKARDLPLSPATATALQAYLHTKRPPPPENDSPERKEDATRAMFVTFRGRRIQPRDVQNLVHRAVAKLPADLRRAVTPHGLRHTAATLLLSSGAADVKTVQALLGHASLGTTGIYLDEVSDEMARAVAAHPVTGN